ncbi:hypothetical protein TWF481_007838 [Arthrobotrys musiformis]|uniref:14-3-3 domain-containing protein n=1 Tax=Arthrobotrys musiformis TaxID=47236 RepID=A0AAV9W7E3_9PEZI
MVGSEVDQKYLGNYAKVVGTHNESLSAALFKVLVRARKQRKLDPTRTTKSLDLYRHIIWMAREGYILLDVYVLPFVLNFIELKVLALKLKASFLHIFVLFDHTYQTKTDFSLPGGPFHQTQPTTPELAEADEQQPVKGQTNSFYNYINIASQAFVTADDYATRLLSGSHPLRLSVKLEYSAFAHDCMKEFSLSRSIARKAIDDAFASMEAMTDESFEDAMDLVSSLGVMARRGGN